VISDVLLWVLLVIAVEAVTEILVDAKITEGLRTAVRRRAYPETAVGAAEPAIGAAGWRFLAELLSCGYCASVWVAIPVASVAPWVHDFSGRYFEQGRHTPGWAVFSWCANWLLDILILHRLSNWLHVAFSLFKKGRVRTYDIELKNIEVTDGSSGQGSGTSGPETGPKAG
jgi:hypothetical protein